MGALATLDGDFVLDGELVALDSQGRPSFQVLQNNLSRSLPVYFYCFDLLNLDGETFMTLPIERRRAFCTACFPRRKIRCASRRYCKRHPVKFLRRCAGSAWKVLSANGSIPSTNPASGQARGSSSARTCSRSLSSAATSPAHAVRCVTRGRLREETTHLRCESEERLCPANSGRLFPALKTLQTAQCPFKNLPEKRASRWGESLTAEKMAQCRWVNPKLVCQVAFVEWTDAGHLRHCTFVAMRDDKKPSEVVLES